MQHAIIQAFFPQSGLIDVRQAATERQLFVVEQRIGQQPHGHTLFGFRRVAGNGLLDAFVHTAIKIGEVQFKLVGRGGLGHGGHLAQRKSRPV
ncbi:hypothetical protein D3C84_1044700 [compost metagenome]